ncbi:MAG: carbamoyltransferase [Acidobacteriota bacterium]
MVILGISAFYHDSAVALIKNGDIIFAAQEERFTRKKHDPAFPSKAYEEALRYTGISPSEIDHVVFYEKPLLKFDRLFSTYSQFAPKGIRSFLSAMPVWFKEKLFIKQIIREKTGIEKIFFCKHHESHASSAFYPSPFESASILTIDGVGEWETLTIGKGTGNKIEMEKSISFPHSLGLLYSAFTYFTGFRVNSGEYKLMGLAPYGEPVYTEKILDNLIDVKEDGSFRLDMKYFNYHVGLTMTSRKFHKLFGAEPRKPETPVRKIDMDMAASVQAALEEIIEKIIRYIKKKHGGDNLTLAGGVALNCVSNGKILKKQIFKNIWIQPASGDAGGALGAALHSWYNNQNNKRTPEKRSDSQKGSFLGPDFKADEIKAFLDKSGTYYEELKGKKVFNKVAELLDNNKVIGIFNGRMEYGPRALGHRSIIGDARSVDMQTTMNVKIKFRESFRPFAPSVLEEHVDKYFDFDHSSPYMLLVYDVLKKWRKKQSANKSGLDKINIVRSEIPAITHVDYSARIHSVRKDLNPFYYNLIDAFYNRTKCPVIINTSFNIRGEPIVNSPEDAFRVFKNTDMDYLLLDHFLIKKNEDERKNIDYEWIKKFPLD